MSNGKDMRDLTKKMLEIDDEDSRLTPEKAIFNEKIGDNNILVLGINPSGDEEDVEREEKCNIFLSYVKYNENKEELKGNLVNNGYFKPIYNLLNEIYHDNIKFSWCNIEEKTLENKLENYIEYVKKQKEENKEKYKNENTDGLIEKCKKVRNEKKEYTILIGDLFYYHDKEADKICKKIDKKIKYIKNDIIKMLDLHIKKVFEKSENLEFILINNAKASEYIIKALTNEEKPITITSYSYPYKYNNKEITIPIFFAGMLSNGGESRYGQKRLIEEIKRTLNIT